MICKRSRSPSPDPVKPTRGKSVTFIVVDDESSTDRDDSVQIVATYVRSGPQPVTFDRLRAASRHIERCLSKEIEESQRVVFGHVVNYPPVIPKSESPVVRSDPTVVLPPTQLDCSDDECPDTVPAPAQLP